MRKNLQKLLLLLLLPVGIKAQNGLTLNGSDIYLSPGSSLYVSGAVKMEDGDNITNNGTGVYVTGNWTGGTSSNATVTGTGKVFLSGNSAQSIGGKTRFDYLQLNNSAGANLSSGALAEIHKILHLQNGTLTTGSGTLKFLSLATNDYAILDNFTSGMNGSVSGNVTADRYVGTSGINQHYFGTPIVNASFGQMGATGTPGFVIPSANCDQTQTASNSPYGSVFQWHDNVVTNATCLYNGWEVKTTGNTSAGKGYSVYLPNGTFSITGNANQGANYPVTGCDNTGWQSNTLQTTGFFPPAYNSGWHIVANPFIAPLTLNGHSGNFDAAAVWVTSGPFAGSYQPISITGGTVAPFQGFIVHRSASSAVDFTFSKGECTLNTIPGFYQTASPYKLNVTVSGNGFNDITYIEFNTDATNGYDVDFDSRKPVSAMGQPTLCTFNTNTTERLSINVNRNITETPNVPMSFIPGANSTFALNFDGINTFDATSYIFLEDLQTGTWTDVRQNPVYNFISTTNDAHARFVLHFTPPAEIATTDATCNTQGTLNIEQPGSAMWQYAVENSNGAAVGSGSLNTGNSVMLNVDAGAYTLTLTDSSGYTVVKSIQVNGVNAPTGSIAVSAASVNTGENIDFNVNSSNGVSFAWDFGDGTTANTGSANHNYTTEGIYTVTLTITGTGGCISVVTQTVTVTDVASGITPVVKNAMKVWSHDNRVFIDFSRAKKVDAQIDFYNVLGQKLLSDRNTRATVYSREIVMPEAAYVIVRINNEGEIISKKLLLLNQ